jgi:nucleoside-diphosphate-sugar epimerase
LLKDGCSVTILDWFLFEPRQFTNPMRGLTCVVGDLRNQGRVKEALEGAEAVIHLAAISNDPSSELDPQATWEINFEASCRLVDLAREAGVKRFINASSASVYGIREEEYVTEDLEARPQTIYARSKVECETYVLANHCSGFTTTSVRPATLSGYAPRMRLDLTVNILTYQAVREGSLRVFGGDQYRPNLAVEDMVRAYLLLLKLDSPKIGGRSFNLVEKNYTVLEIAYRIAQVLERDQIQVQQISSNDNRSYRLCGDRALSELGFSPEVNLDRSILNVAEALQDGRIRDPDHARYRNVNFLRGRNLTALTTL